MHFFYVYVAFASTYLNYHGNLAQGASNDVTWSAILKFLFFSFCADFDQIWAHKKNKNASIFRIENILFLFGPIPSTDEFNRM